MKAAGAGAVNVAEVSCAGASADGTLCAEVADTGLTDTGVDSISAAVDDFLSAAAWSATAVTDADWTDTLGLALLGASLAVVASEAEAGAGALGFGVKFKTFEIENGALLLALLIMLSLPKLSVGLLASANRLSVSLAV